MSTVPEASLSTLASNSNSNSAPLCLLLIGLAAVGFYYASPMRLSCVLVTAIADTEQKYLTAVENGVLYASIAKNTGERLSISQLKASNIRETSLRSSLSPVSALCDTFNFRRSVAVLRCLAEVHGLETYIEISNEAQLRDIDSHSFSNRATISLRRRHSPGRN